jgi:hypothetical protein
MYLIRVIVKHRLYEMSEMNVFHAKARKHWMKYGVGKNLLRYSVNQRIRWYLSIRGTVGCHANHSIIIPVPFVGNASNGSCYKRSYKFGFSVGFTDYNHCFDNDALHCGPPNKGGRKEATVRKFRRAVRVNGRSPSH